MDLHRKAWRSVWEKSQSTIANKIRLLHLSEPVKQSLMERKKITERHARALLSLDDTELQMKVLQDIISKELNVKQTEARIQFFFKESEKIKRTKRVSYTKDVRLALNTIRQSVEMVSSSGLHIHTAEQDREDHYEIIIRIPKKNSNRLCFFQI